MQIILESLTKRFGSLHALDNVSLTIEPSQIVAVLGPNGAGKTTLLQCLSAILAPDGGRILYDGELFNRGRADLRKRLSFLPEFPIMFPHIGFYSFLAFGYLVLTATIGYSVWPAVFIAATFQWLLVVSLIVALQLLPTARPEGLNFGFFLYLPLCSLLRLYSFPQL